MSYKKNRKLRQEAVMQRLGEALGSEYAVAAIRDYGEEFIARIDPQQMYAAPLDKLLVSAKLDAQNLKHEWIERADGYFIRIELPEEQSFPWVNVVLFAITLVTVFFVPQYSYYAEHAILILKSEPLDFFTWIGTPSAWEISWGLSFTCWLLGILLAHEFGHYFAGRRRGLRLTLPYFIPFPNLIGTMGAVIRFKSPITNRRDLIEVGAAGPLAGFVVALIAAVIGVAATNPSINGSFSFQGESILMTFLGRTLLGDAAFGHTLSLHPAAFAAWVGFLVTALNMIPLSQLDGGHVVYGLFGRFQRVVSFFGLVGLFIAGFYWSGWWFYGALTLFFGPFHPPTLDDQKPLSMTAQIMAWAAIIVLVLCFNLAPFGLG